MDSRMFTPTLLAVIEKVLLIMKSYSVFNKHSMNPPQQRGDESVSPRRDIPIEIVERNHEAHVRRHSVSPSRRS
ncbi:unnamed protein product [Rodentolepis nana]|uniref:PDEase domain-containing protein n=1 Tax=Rodentolepis nana TaxID=102285 RepID=A0A0R3TPX1_RODNA|nr:unnamed protein product [Rodentolepis nana]